MMNYGFVVVFERLRAKNSKELCPWEHFQIIPMQNNFIDFLHGFFP